LFFNYFKALGYFVGGHWTSWGGRRRIEAKQLRNLRRLVKKVRKNSPLFQRLYAGLPESSSIELKDLPVTYKRELMSDFDDWLTIRTLTLTQARAHIADMKNLAVPIEGVVVFRTSGTSGEPAVIVLPASHLEFVLGISFARMEKNQIRLMMKARKAGLNVSIAGGNGHFGGIGVNKLFRDILPGSKRHFPFISAEQPLDKLVKQLNDMQNVASITTYPSVLTILTKEKEAGRLNIEPLAIKVAGETLTDELKDRAQRAFSSLECPVINAYATTECLFIAQECSFGRQHVAEDWVILEPVDKNMRPVPDGTLSDKALLTVLSNDVQPFIRYVLGDRLRFYKDPCPCGSPFRSFQVEGRQATLIHVGEVTLSPLIFDLEHERAQRSQLVQVKEDEFEIRVDLLDKDDSDKVFEDLIKSVMHIFEENGLSQVKVKKASAPPKLTASGKFCEVLPLKKMV
jgi:phenylacetate-CoA ligase